VTANDTVDVDSQSYGLAGGAVAGAVNFKTSSRKPDRSLSRSRLGAIKATGDGTVIAGTDIDASSKSLGVARASSARCGSFARSEVSPTVHDYWAAASPPGWQCHGACDTHKQRQ